MQKKHYFLVKDVIAGILFFVVASALSLGGGMIFVIGGQGLQQIVGIYFLAVGGAAFFFFVKLTAHWNVLLRGGVIGLLILFSILLAVSQHTRVTTKQKQGKAEYALKLENKLEDIRSEMEDDGMARIQFIAKTFEGGTKTGNARRDSIKAFTEKNIIGAIGEQHFSDISYKSWGSYDVAVRTTITAEGFEQLIQNKYIDTYLLYKVDDQEKLISNDSY